MSVATVREGRAFAALLSGPSPAVGPFLLTIPGGKGPLTLTFDRPVFQAGQFAAPVRLTNGTGVPLSGLRLDVTGVSVVDAASGNAIRDPVDPGVSPLWFGELAPGQESAAVLLQVDVDLPEGTKGTAVVEGNVSGASVAADPEAADEAGRLFRARQRLPRGCTAEILADIKGEDFGRVGEPVGCRTDPAGRLWVVDLSGDPLKVYDARSGFVRTLGPGAAADASDLAFGSGGRVFPYEAGERPGTGFYLRTLRPF